MHGYKRIMNGEEPAVTQAKINQFQLSWNPDDNRYYVEKGEAIVATFKEFRNAVQYAKTH